MNTSMPNQPMYYVKCIIVFLITFGIGFLPPVGSLTPMGMKAIGIFCGVLFGWAMVDMLWPSLLGIFAVGLSGYMTIPQSLACAFSDNITLQTLFILIFVGYLEVSGCSSYIARWIITRKCAVGRPWLLSLLILLSGFVLSMFTMGISAILIAWAIFYEICALLNMTKSDKWTTVMLWGIVFSGLAGAICLPYQIMSVIFIGATEQSANISINTLEYSSFRITASFFLIVLYWLVCKYLIKPDVTKIIAAGDVFKDMRERKITYDEKIGIIVFFVFLFVLVFIANLPKGLPFIGFLKSLGLLGTIVLLIILLSIFRITRNGVEESIMHFNKLTKKINWTTVLLVGGIAPMSKLLESPEAGIFQSILAILTPLTDILGSTGFVVAVALLLFLVTQISHNIVLARLVIPLVIPLGMSLDIPPLLMLSSIILPLQMAFCTPGASANVALIWGNQQWIAKESIIRISMICALLVILYNNLIIIPVSFLLYQ